MTGSLRDVVSQHNREDAAWVALARDRRYGHHARIPGRICRCLDYFHVSSDGPAIQERLHAYYLFVGVVDDEIDSVGLEAGREVLEQLRNEELIFQEPGARAPVAVVTEVLKRHISLEIFPAVLQKLEELYETVVRERNSQTMRAYVEQRVAIGCLTADLSYLLIRPLLPREYPELRRFLQRVGEVGCLIDSVIDLRADDRLGLLAFRPGLRDYLYLVRRMFHDGFKVLRQHPRLLGLFLEAIRDNAGASKNSTRVGAMSPGETTVE